MINTSVTIFNYNTYELTRACVASIVHYCPHQIPEIIVVSNSSSDRPISGLVSEFPMIQLIELESNIGFAAANNVGINIARHPYVLLLNSDTELQSNCIAQTAAILEQHPDIGAVTTALIFPNGEFQNNFQQFPSAKKEALEFFRLHRVFKSLYYKWSLSPTDHSKNQYCDWIWGAYFHFRKADLTLLNGQRLSERFFMYGEDIEWGFQFQKIGKRCFFLSEEMVVHHMGASNFGDDFKKLKTIIDHEKMIIKTYKGFLAVKAWQFFKFLNHLSQLHRNKRNWKIACLYL